MFRTKTSNMLPSTIFVKIFITEPLSPATPSRRYVLETLPPCTGIHKVVYMDRCMPRLDYPLDDPCMHQHTRTAIYIYIIYIREHGGHVATLQGQRRDESQHIAQAHHGGELPVGAVAAVAHGPGDEGTSRHRRPEGDGGESSAVTERPFANIHQRVWE